MNENESRIRELLGEGIGEEPPVVGGPAAVFAGARRHTVRTRAIAGALSVVAVLGVAAAVVAVGGGAGRSGASTVSPGVTTPAEQVPQVPIDGRSVAEILKLELPAGLTTGSYEGADSDPNSAAYAGMAVNDGTGKLTQIQASVGRRPSEAISAQACDNMDHKGFPGISGCQAHMQPDGSVVLVYRVDADHRDAHGHPLDAYQLIAEHLFPGGMDVLVSAANWFTPLSDPSVPAEMVGPSRPTPVLSLDQLQHMVMDRRWGFTVPADLARQAEHDITPYFEETRH
jgi:hypothetical protein